MAGIFDNFSTLNLTPEERKALQAQAKGGALRGALEGEYLGRATGIANDVPLLEADPVSTQAQSRVGPERAARTFYANTAGDVGTSVPKGSGTSGVYSVAEEAAPKAARGILRTAGKALGPAGILLDLANPEAVGDAELTPAQQQAMAEQAVGNMAPQLRADAVNFAQGVSDRAVNQAMGRGNPIDLRDPQAPRSNLYEPLPEQPVAVETPVGPAASAAPQTEPQRVVAQQQQQEAVRQQVEDSAVTALSEGQLTRPQAAEAVVKADAQRAGVTLTPDQTKAAVADELGSMKSMDNSQLGRYISYAAIAGGLIASFMDKSGQTSQLFASSMNKEMDRQLARGQAEKKAQAKAAELKAEQANKDREFGLKEKDFGRKVKADENLAEYRGDQTDIAREGNEIRRSTAANTAAYQQQSLGLRREGMAQRAAQNAQQQSNWDKMFGFREAEAAREQGNTEARLQQGQQRIRQGDEANLIAAKRAQDAANKGPTMSAKEAEEAIKATAKAQGVDLDKAVLKNAAQQLRQHAANNAKAVQSNPSGVINQILQGPGYTVNPGQKRSLWFDKDPSVTLKK